MVFKKEDLEDFSLFDPESDGENKIVNAPGNYAVLLRPGSHLPECEVRYKPSMVKYKGAEYEVVYVGVSSNSLRERDYKKHFNGNNAGQSTLRKSIGSLMGLKKTLRSAAEAEKRKPKTKFVNSDEKWLTEWMRKNLILLFKNNSNYKDIEKEMIKDLNPPLNIKENPNYENMEFRSHLTKLRNDISDLI
ncbi:MAG: hypothetical protein K2J49_05620 [Muribaculaceae bacterium]|nr:hypothetical protein [Muribaculaceae bacterium]